MKNPQTSTFTEKRERQRERVRETQRKGSVLESKRTSAAKLSLNIISLSLMHYLFSKLLRADLAVCGQEVTHYAFYNKAACGF